MSMGQCSICENIIDTDFQLQSYKEQSACDCCMEDLYAQGLVDEDGYEIKQKKEN